MPVNFKVGKVNAHRINSRGKHNLDHDVTTSISFGTVTPLLCKMMTPSESLKGKIDTQIRVMPLPLPPHGRIKMHTYAQFVKMNDIYRPFPEFLAQKPFASSRSQYIPSELPSLPICPSPGVLYSKTVSGKETFFIAPQSGVMYNFSLLGYLFGKEGTFWGVKRVESTQVTIGTDTDSNNSNSVTCSFDNTLTNPWISGAATGTSVTSTNIPTSLVNSMIGIRTFSSLDLTQSKGDTAPSRVSPDGIVSDGLLEGESYKPANYVEVYSGLPNSGRCVSVADASKVGLDEKTCDFRFIIRIKEGTYNDNCYIGPAVTGTNYVTFADTSTYMVIVKLSREGREILKALRVLGYDINASSAGKLKNILPIFAYYKAWFDIFYPQRNIAWRSTYAFKLMDTIAELGRSPYQWQFTDKQDLACALWLRYIFDDIANMHPTSDPNYFSIAITRADETSFSEPEGGSLSQSDLDFKENLASLTSTNGTITTNRSTQSGRNIGEAPTYNLGSQSITWNALRLLRGLTKFVNTNTVLGQSVNAFINSHFGGNAGESFTSTFAGSSVTDVELGDIIQTATTDKANAGDFAGVGYGKGGFVIKYKTDCAGFYIVLATIKPVCNYVQGQDYDTSIVKPLEFPTPEFDAVGYDSISSDELFGVRTGGLFYPSSPASGLWNPANDYGNKRFGYVPRYTGHKVKKSVLTGDFALPSTRDYYMGFTLDHYISQDVVTSKTQAKYDYLTITNPAPKFFTAGTLWRWLCKYPFLDNFDRIFYDASPTSATLTRQAFTGSGDIPRGDDFLVFNHIELKSVDNLKSIGACFDTLDGADNYVEHQ